MANDFIGKVAAAALADFDGTMGFLGLSGGKNQAREYLPINPNRSDHKAGSFSINRDSGRWSDFATDDSGGDLVALAAFIFGVRQIEAAEHLADHFGIAKQDRQQRAPSGEREAGKGKAPPPPASAPQAPADGGAVCLMPIPEDAPAPPVAHSRHGKPAARWAYTDAAGAVCFFHDRYEPKGDRKQFAPLTLWRLPDGRQQWQFKAPPAPRPLLGLPGLATKPGPVLIVEGEKARDAAVSLFPENPVITWQGGAQAVNKAGFAPLAGRDCWLWPDADPAGEKAMRDVAAALAAVNAGKVSVFNLAAFARRAIEAEGAAALADGEPLAAGDDAADLVARGWTAAHMALLLLEPDTLRLLEAPAPAPAAAAAGGEGEAGKGKTSPPPASAPQAPADGGAVCLLPIPEDAPAPPVAHSRYGKPAARWAYTDAAGAVCFYHDRYEPQGERKQFSPLTLWRLPDGRLQWQFKAPPAPRPLLGLPGLATKPGPVLIVEGEKARDAAVSLFPENPVITWQGGAQAVAKAGFAPLAGRDCWLWPDADPAGEKAMRDVAAALAAVNAGKVSVFNLAAFARRAIEAEGAAALADGEPLAAGDDAADLVARGWTAAHMALLLLEPDTLRPLEAPAPAPAAAAAGEGEAPKANRFQLNAKGVWLIETDRAPRWVCAPLHVAARVRDPKNAGWGLLTEFDDPDRQPHRVIIPAALFRGDGAEVAGLLLDQGLQIAPRGRSALVEYLQTASPKARAWVTQRTGWHDASPEGAAFVLPGGAIGPNAGAWIYESEGGPVHTFAMRSNLGQWKNEVARLCSGNSRLLFAVSVCFASPLLKLVGAESGGFHYRGNSADGKTTCLQVAGSVCGGADYMQRWRTTSNGLEALASAHCDAPLLLDELAQMDPREAGEVAYMLANGSGKSRAGRTGGARDRASWRLLFLSSGEIGLSEHLGEIGKAPRAGQELRLAEIPADAGAGLGVFENLHDYATGSEFAKALGRAARGHYGTAFQAFVAELAKHQEAVPELVREAQKKFEAHCLNEAAHGQARRVAGRFALVGAAGELATKWGITGWQPGEALQAARTCFEAWLSRRGGQGNQEEKAMLRQVREFIRRKGESAFTDWDRPANDTDKHAPGKPDRAGYRRGCHDAEGNDAQEYFLFNEAWRGVVCKGYDAAAVGRLLVAKGYCRKGSETDRPWLVRESLPTEGRARVVHILPALFDSDDD